MVEAVYAVLSFTRGNVFQLSAGLSLPLLSGYVSDIDQLLNYEPGAISGKTNDDERHMVTVT